MLGIGQQLLDEYYPGGVHRAALATLRRFCVKINVDKDKHYPVVGYESEAALAYNIAAVISFYKKVSTWDPPIFVGLLGCLKVNTTRSGGPALGVSQIDLGRSTGIHFSSLFW